MSAVKSVKKQVDRTVEKVAAPKAAKPKPAAARAAAPKAGAPVAHGVGRRKSAVARVFLRRGKGNVLVNGRVGNDYFDTDVARRAMKVPFVAVPDLVNYDIEVNVVGGGINGQADAAKLGIARALVVVDEALRSVLRSHGLLTVDARNKERKKYGQKAARRRFQFVKR